MNLQPRFAFLSEKILVGKHLPMSLAANKTGPLWGSFMPQRKSILNTASADLYSLQIYPTDYFSAFSPERLFEKWAAIEVSSAENLPDGMESMILPGGWYAVFHHKGMDPAIFGKIYTEWLPKSGLALENRPHFELLGANYKNGDPESEEEIWIPVNRK